MKISELFSKVQGGSVEGPDDLREMLLPFPSDDAVPEWVMKQLMFVGSEIQPEDEEDGVKVPRLDEEEDRKEEDDKEEEDEEEEEEDDEEYEDEED